MKRFRIIRQASHGPSEVGEISFFGGVLFVRWTSKNFCYGELSADDSAELAKVVSAGFPTDYEPCGVCGFDHSYEQAEAVKAHEKLESEGL